MRTTTFGRYRTLLARASVRRLLLVGMLARIPHAAAGVLLTLHVVNSLGRGYAAAGAVAASITVGLAIGAPWRGRRVDTVGLRVALIPSVIAEAVIWSVAPFLPYELLIPAAVLGGLFALPVFSVIRQSLAVLVPDHERRTAYALDSMATELVFVIGPALGVVLATSFPTTFGLVLVGVCSAAAGLLMMWFNPPTRSNQLGAHGPDGRTPGAAPGDRRSALDVETDAVRTIAPAEVAAATDAVTSSLPLITSSLAVVGRDDGNSRTGDDGDDGGTGRTGGDAAGTAGAAGRRRWRRLSPVMLAVLGAAAGTGLLLSGTDVGIVAVLREHGFVDSLGLVFLFWCGASVVGGVIYGALSRPVSPLLLLAGMGLLTIPLGLATDPVSLGLLALGPGLLCAPTLTACSERVADLVEERRRGQAMGWYGSALTTGSALGSPLIGVAVDGAGPTAGFSAVGVVALLIAVVGLLLGLRRRRRTQRSAADG